MFNCRIGIISKHNIPGIPYLNLGEFIGDKSDLNLLYRIHTDLSYMYPFYGICKINKSNKTTDVIPSNIQDFIYLQDKYMLTRHIFIPKRVEVNTIQFKTPQLYDISCGVQLLDYHYKPPIKYNPSSSKTLIFVIPPYKNPVLRGKSIDSCIDLYSQYTDHNIFFIITGELINPNKIEIWKLSRKYLIKRGVPDKAIIHINHGDNLISSVNDIITILLTDNDVKNSKVYFSVKTSDMDKYLLQSRNIHKKFKLFFISG